MAQSKVSVTEGSGKNLNTWDRTISSVLVQDQFVQPGEYPYPTYSVVPTASVSIATGDSHVLQIMAGSSLHVRIRRIHFEQAANAGTAAFTPVEIWRLTTAGTGGTAYTARPFDTGDAAAGATAMTLPSSKGTESVLLLRTIVTMRSAASTNGSQEDTWEWGQLPGQKPIIIPAGTSNGIAIKTTTAVASATVAVWVEFVETAFL